MPNDVNFIMAAAKAAELEVAHKLELEIKALEIRLEETMKRTDGEALDQVALELSSGTRPTTEAFVVQAALQLFKTGRGLAGPGRFAWAKLLQELNQRGVKCGEDLILSSLRSRPDLFESAGKGTWYFNEPTPRPAPAAVAPSDRVLPLVDGLAWHAWQARNCVKCALRHVNEGDGSSYHCDLEAALDRARLGGDLRIAPEFAERIGFTSDTAANAKKKCAEFREPQKSASSAASS